MALGIRASASLNDPMRDKEFTQVSRGFLEALVAQVPGLTMEWRGGDPVFTQYGEKLGLSNNLYRTAEQAGSAREAAAKQQLRDEGVSEADLAATERLLRAIPLPPNMPEKVQAWTWATAGLISKETAMKKLL